MTTDYLKSLQSGTQSSQTYTKTQKSSSSDSNSSSSSGSLTGNQTINQQEFLTLLVNQLQQQDPLNPMDSQQFAAQLATFSQLEQLISINEKMDNLSSGGETSISSMASFLGQEVVLEDQSVSIADGEGPNLQVTVPEGCQSARVDFIDEDNQVVGTHQLTDVESGKQTFDLTGVNVSDGTYDVRVVGVAADGRFRELDATVTGTVEGFVMEPSPALIVGGQQVALDRVAEVRTATKSSK